MTRKATLEQLKLIRDKVEELGWGSSQEERQFIAASKILLFGDSSQGIKGRFDPFIQNYCIKKSDFEDNEQLLHYPHDRQDYRKELNCFTTNDCLIPTYLIEEWIENRIIYACGVYRNTWEKFCHPKKLGENKEDIFRAYWVALGFSLEDLGIITPEKIKANRIYHAILTLDHTEQVTRLEDIGGKNARVGTFLIDTQCQCSRAWLMWRLETAILSFDDDSTNQVQRYALNVLSTDNIQTIKDTIYQKVTRFSTENYNLIITIDNIDCLDRSKFVFLLNSIEEWKMIIRESSNYFILYLIDRGKDNNWRKDDQLYETIKVEVTQQLTLPQLTQGLRSIYRKLRSYLDQENLGHNLDIDSLAEQFITQTNNGQFRPVLEKIYPHFKCDLQGETRWFNYP